MTGPLLPELVLDSAASGSPLRVSGLQGSSPSWAVASQLEALGAPVLWVCATARDAELRLAELRFHAQGTEAEVLPYPEWDSKPYRGYSPSAAITRRRLAALHRLAQPAPAVVVAPAVALLKRVLPADRLALETEKLRLGTDIDRDALVQRLVQRGYLATDLCGEPGSFAVRGGILDVWTPSHPSPVRIELWGDTIDSMRRFDPWTQRSIEPLEELVLLPAREEILTEATLEGIPAVLKRLADERGQPPAARIQLQRELADQRLLQEMELFLPLLCPNLVSVLDTLPAGGLVVWDGPGAIEASLLGVVDGYRGRWRSEGGAERLVPAPEDLFLEGDELVDLGVARAGLILAELHEDSEGDLRVEAPDNADLRAEILAARDGPAGMLAPLVERVRGWRRDGVEVRAVGSRRQGEQLAALLQPYDLGLELVVGDVSRGFRLPSHGLVWLAADELLGPRKKAAANRRRPQGHEAIGSLGQLGKGDLVVHAIHGIGRFEGLSKLRLGASASEQAADLRARAADPSYKPGTGGPLGGGGGNSNDFLLLVYRDGDRLYLPVHKLDLLSRYVAAGGPTPRLDKLGGQTWARRRKKVAEEVQKVARELLELYARRQLATAHAYSEPDSYFHEFCAGFPWEETPDQQAAIDAVLADMRSPRPMDRLVCGDVGFGKTEVALRAAFLAVEEGKQVAVLVPTTILALQHFEAFRQRLEAFPVEVEMLSRFRTAAESRRTMARLAEGKTDIVVGTHRLLSKDIRFRDLGLLVVDEEHRFGVRHKERIKELRAGVHVLTMTATPIPRTLHMALAGIRDFSTITTAPEGRQAVRTSVARFSPRRLQDALRFELDRGGQVFFVHNRVRTIHRMADFLHKLVPGIRLRVAHGQMPEKELEAIMLDFYQRSFDVLLSTTIVESGIDVPTANTMIINRADAMGLAQLHQLRGRVGRGGERGFCLLLVPPGRSLRRIALERLRVIQDNADLGSGHRIAQHDLQLRGAGNLLGSKQSGHIADVGLVTYMELLEGAVRTLQGRGAVGGPDPEVELKSDAWIPGDYVPDERDRLAEYKRLADCRTRDELAEVFEDLTDRYGRPPAEVMAFERLIEVKVLCRELRIVSLRAVRGGRLQVTFDPATPVDPGHLLAWVERDPRKLTFRPEGLLLASLTPSERKAPVETALTILAALRDCVASVEPETGGEALDPQEPAC